MQRLSRALSQGLDGSRVLAVVLRKPKRSRIIAGATSQRGLIRIVTMAVQSRAEVAQLVEQWTENPCVGGSSPPLGTNPIPCATGTVTRLPPPHYATDNVCRTPDANPTPDPWCRRWESNPHGPSPKVFETFASTIPPLRHYNLRFYPTPTPSQRSSTRTETIAATTSDAESPAVPELMKLGY